MPAASRLDTTADQRSTTERGYGSEHKKARVAAASEHHPDDPCARCGHALGPMGPNLHFDHDGDRTGYLGFSHGGPCETCGKRCNAAAGGRERGRRQAEANSGEFVRPPRRDWYA